MSCAYVTFHNNLISHGNQQWTVSWHEHSDAWMVSDTSTSPPNVLLCSIMKRERNGQRRQQDYHIPVKEEYLQHVCGVRPLLASADTWYMICSVVNDLWFSWLMDLIWNPSLIILMNVCNSSPPDMLIQFFCTTENCNCSIPIVSTKLKKVFQTTYGIRWIKFSLCCIMKSYYFLQEAKAGDIFWVKMWIIKIWMTWC